MKKTVIYSLFAFLLLFAFALVLPVIVTLDKASRGMVEEMEKVAPLSTEQKLIFGRFVDAARDDFLSLSFYVFIAVLFASVFLGRRLLRPVKELHDAAASMKGGNYGMKPGAFGDSELGDVAAVFDAMAVSLRQKTEELALKERYVSMMMDPLWVLDNENIITDINPAFTKLLGYAREDAVGYPVFDFMDEVNEKIMRKQLGWMESGESSSYEITLISKHGEAIPVLMSGAPIFGDGGEVVGKIGIMKDFREELARRKALREAGEHCRVIMDSMPDALIVVDRDHNIISANSAAEEMADGGIAGRHCHEIFSPQSPGRQPVALHDCPVAAVFSKGKPHRAVHEFFDHGTYTYKEIIAYPIKDESGTVRNAVALARDVTEKKNFEREVARKNRELETLLDISKTLSQSLRAEEIFNAVLDRLLELTGMDGGAIYFLDEMGRELGCHYSRGLSAEYVKSAAIFRVGEEIPGRVAATEQIFTTADLAADERAEKSVFLHAGIRACAFFPIRGKEKTTGVFLVFSFSPRYFSPEDEQILGSVGEIAGMAFENIRLYEKMRLMYQHQKWRKGDEQRKLLELASVLATKLDVKDMLDTAVNMIKQFLRADFAWFLEVDSRGNLVLKSASDSGIPEGTVIYEKGSSCIEWAAIEGKKPVVVPDLASGSGVDLPGHLAGQNFKTACSVPVYSGAEAFAAISFYCSSFRQPKEEDIYFLQTVANIVDVALERARLYDRLMIGKGMSEAIIESMSDGIITTDTNGSVITMNNAALSMARLGQDPAGTHVAGLFSGSEENDRFGLLLAEGLKETMKGVRLRRETVITGAEGAVVPIVLNAYPARDKEGEVASAVFVLRDMSRHEEVDRLKSEFLRSVSHEFRTPLAAIVGMSEMILDGEVPEEKERIYLETILGEGRKLSGVVSDLLDLAAIEGGKEVLRMEEIDAGALLREIAGEFSPIAQKKGITVKVSTGGPLPVSGDPGRLKQLLRNLVENSLAYSDSGAVVDLLASREDGLCELTVRDTGWGIPEDDIKHLGEKFYRGKNAASTRGKGLGLSLVKEIVRVHCGALKIESCKGKGTTVRISLPARRPGEKDNNN